MLSFREYGPRWAALLLVAAIMGCGDSGPTIVPVTGTLAHKGHPVSNVYIFFMPADGNGRPSQGPTDADGRFKLNYTNEKDGVMVGKHKVWIGRPRPSTQLRAFSALLVMRFPWLWQTTKTLGARLSSSYNSKNRLRVA